MEAVKLFFIIGLFQGIRGADESAPRIVHSDTPFDHRFLAENALINSPENHQAVAKYFLLPNNVANKGFVVDTGRNQSLGLIDLKNTHNDANDDRGTKGFALDISDDNQQWERVYTGILPDPRGLKDKVPMEKVFIGDKFGRYIRFTATSYFGHGAGLNYIGWSKFEEGVCGSGMIVQANAPFDVRFEASGALTNNMCEGGACQRCRYYLAPNHQVNQGFTVDTGCLQKVNFVKLRNTHNGANNDRGTKGFVLDVSDDLQNWRLNFQGTLSNAIHKGCNTPMEDVYFGQTFRYIRFRATSFYGYGAGLNYLGWTTDFDEPMKIKSMGCYSNANWVLEGARILNNNQTVCAKHCAENFFGLSGVSNSIFCSCGSQLNASAAQADASKCSVKCPEQNELCGGTSEIQVSENIFA